MISIQLNKKNKKNIYILFNKKYNEGLDLLSRLNLREA